MYIMLCVPLLFLKICMQFSYMYIIVIRHEQRITYIILLTTVQQRSDMKPP